MLHLYEVLIKAMLFISLLDLQCWVQGSCQGILVDDTASDSGNDCLEICQDTENCSWFTYDSVEGDCILLEDCQQLDTTCVTCSSGQRSCSDQGMIAFSNLY